MKYEVKLGAALSASLTVVIETESDRRDDVHALAIEAAQKFTLAEWRDVADLEEIWAIEATAESSPSETFSPRVEMRKAENNRGTSIYLALAAELKEKIKTYVNYINQEGEDEDLECFVEFTAGVGPSDDPDLTPIVELGHVDFTGSQWELDISYKEAMEMEDGVLLSLMADEIRAAVIEDLRTMDRKKTEADVFDFLKKNAEKEQGE